MLTINLEFIKSHKQFPAYGIGTHSHSSHSHTQHMHAHTQYTSLVPRFSCVGGEKRALYILFAHAQFSKDFMEFGNFP